jgi:hypothetical protein
VKLYHMFMFYGPLLTHGGEDFVLNEYLDPIIKTEVGKKIATKLAECKREWSGCGPVKARFYADNDYAKVVFVAKFTELELHNLKFIAKKGHWDEYLGEIKSVMESDFNNVFSSLYDGLKIVSIESTVSGDDFSKQTTLIKLNKNLEQLISNGQVNIN